MKKVLGIIFLMVVLLASQGAIAKDVGSQEIHGTLTVSEATTLSGALAQGLGATATGTYAAGIAGGDATGETSFAAASSTASGKNAAAVASSLASASASFAAASSIASGIGSVALGVGQASGLYSFAAGNGSQATSTSSVGIGKGARSSHAGAIAIGSMDGGTNYLTTSADNEVVLGSLGVEALQVRSTKILMNVDTDIAGKLAQGGSPTPGTGAVALNGSTASGSESFAATRGTATAQFSSALGNYSQATAASAHADSAGNASGAAAHADSSGTASGGNAHAGASGIASGLKSSSHGAGSVSSGAQSHTLGYYNEASGSYAIGIGVGTKATHDTSMVIGFDDGATGYLTSSAANEITLGTLGVEAVQIRSTEVLVNLPITTMYEVSDEGLVLSLNYNTENMIGTAGAETVFDASGYGNHGTNVTAFTSASGGFNSGGCINTSSTGYTAVVDHASIKPTGAVSVSFWVRWNVAGAVGDGGWKWLVTKGKDATSTDGYAVEINSSNQLAFYLDGTSALIGTAAAGIVGQTWYHVTGTGASGGNPKIYLNGVLQATGAGTVPTPIVQSTFGLRVGTVAYYAGDKANAKFDDVRVYNRALSANEIKSLYLQRSEMRDSYVSQKRVTVGSAGKVGINQKTPVSALHVYESNATVGTANGLTIEQASTGDALLQYLLTGGQRWVMGTDNDDSDKFKIASSTDLATNARLTIDTSGNVSLSSGASVNEFSTDGTMAGNSDAAVPTEKAVVTYVAAQVGGVGTLNTAGGTGTGSIALKTQTLTIAGTANEIATVAGNQTVTISLPDDVVIGDMLNVTTNAHIGAATDASERLVVGTDFGNINTGEIFVIGNSAGNSHYLIGESAANGISASWIKGATASDSFAVYNTAGLQNNLFMNADVIALQETSNAAWVSGNYVVGQSVSYIGGFYYCHTNTTSSQVPTDTNFWVDLGDIPSGFVGIGLQNPAYKLDILTNVSSYAMNIFNNGNSESRQGLRIQAGPNAPAAGDSMFFLLCADGAGGELGGVALDDGVFKFLVLSDENRKNSIAAATIDGTAILSRLQVREYQLNGSDAKHTGFIAQEVAELLPEAATSITQTIEATAEDYGKDGYSTRTVITWVDVSTSATFVHLFDDGTTRSYPITERTSQTQTVHEIIQTTFFIAPMNFIPILVQVAQKQQEQINGMKSEINALWIAFGILLIAVLSLITWARGGAVPSQTLLKQLETLQQQINNRNE